MKSTTKALDIVGRAPIRRAPFDRAPIGRGCDGFGVPTPAQPPFDTLSAHGSDSDSDSDSSEFEKARTSEERWAVFVKEHHKMAGSNDRFRKRCAKSMNVLSTTLYDHASRLSAVETEQKQQHRQNRLVDVRHKKLHYKVDGVEQKVDGVEHKLTQSNKKLEKQVSLLMRKVGNLEEEKEQKKASKMQIDTPLKHRGFLDDESDSFPPKAGILDEVGELEEKEQEKASHKPNDSPLKPRSLLDEESVSSLPKARLVDEESAPPKAVLTPALTQGGKGPPCSKCDFSIKNYGCRCNIKGHREQN